MNNEIVLTELLLSAMYMDDSPAFRRQFAAVVNPRCGRGGALAKVRRIAHVLAEHNALLDVHVTTGPGHATRLAANCVGRYDAVLAVGGDGTACEVVNGLVSSGTPLAILGMGTENLIARETQMPVDAVSMADTLRRGRTAPCDVGVVNGRRFLAVVGVGFDADCVERLTRIRRGHITHFDYFWPIFRAFWSYRFPRLRVETDGEILFDDRGLAFVGLIARYSAGMRICANARTTTACSMYASCPVLPAPDCFRRRFASFRANTFNAAVLNTNNVEKS